VFGTFAMSKLRTFLVEDSPIIRESLVAALEELAPLEVVGYAEDEFDKSTQIDALIGYCQRLAAVGGDAGAGALDP